MPAPTRTRYINNYRRYYRYSTSVAYTQLRITRTIPEHIHYTHLVPPSPVKDDSPANVKTFYNTDALPREDLAVAGLDIIEGITETCVELYAPLDDRIGANREDLLVILTSSQTHASLGKLADVAAQESSIETAATAFRAEIGRIALEEGDSKSVELWSSLFICNLIMPTIDEMTGHKTLKRKLRRIVGRDGSRFRWWRETATPQCTTTDNQPSSTLPLKRSSDDAVAVATEEQPGSIPLFLEGPDSPQIEPDRPQILGRSRKANCSIFIPSEQSLRIGHRYPGAPTKRIDNFWLQGPSSESPVKKARNAD